MYAHFYSYKNTIKTKYLFCLGIAMILCYTKALKHFHGKVKVKLYFCDLFEHKTWHTFPRLSNANKLDPTLKVIT